MQAKQKLRERQEVPEKQKAQKLSEQWKIVTERLELVPNGMQYLDTTHAYSCDPDNTRYMMLLPSESLEETKDFLQKAQQQWEKEVPDYYEFAILRNGVHIGGISLEPDKACRSAELGWIIHKDYWRCGYGKEAAKALVDYAVSKLGIRHFFAHCDSANMPSYKVMEAIGMHLTQRHLGRKNRNSDEIREELTYEMDI